MSDVQKHEPIGNLVPEVGGHGLPPSLQILLNEGLYTRIKQLSGVMPLPVPGMRVVASQQAIVLGWWSWQYSFDPAWLVDCDKFEAADGEAL